MHIMYDVVNICKSVRTDVGRPGMFAYPTVYTHRCSCGLEGSYQQSSVLPDSISCFGSAKSWTSHLHAGGSGASWIELERELAEDLRPKRGSFAADGEIGLAAADPGRLCVLSMGDTVLWLFWLSTESVDDDERERRMYGRGGGFFGSSVGGMGFSTGGGTSAPYSSTIRGGGRSTIASSSCMRPNS